MDLLLDVNIVLDICQPCPAHLHAALRAISKCRREGGRMWLYAGSVQTLEYNLVRGLVDAAIARACREIRVHGQSGRYVHTRIGVGGRMDTLQCAVVLAKLERFDEEIRRRIEIGDRYNRLMDQAGIARVRQRPDRGSVFAQYTVFVERREPVREALQQAGIPVAVHYPLPLNEQPAYRQLCCSEGTPVAKATAQRVLSVPMGADLRPEQQDRVVEALHAAVHGGTR